jgi:DNA-binding LytR/AlgR family response regulator
MKTLIVDDEPLALDLLETFIERLDCLHLVGRCEDGIQAFNILQKGEVELLFLDIEMPTLDGYELLRSLPNPPKTIITTAYRDYAVEGFELNVLDYLVKPIPFQRFVQAVQKAAPKAGELTEIQAVGQPVTADALFIKVDKRIVRVPFDQIYFIESLKDYIKVHTTRGTLVTLQTMQGLCELLPSEMFVRIHKSFTISIPKVSAIDANDVEINGKLLPIGRSYREEILGKIYNTGILAIK